MQLRVRKFAHVLERIGLAMAGASSGLFVGSYVGSSIAALTSQGFLVVMMIGGAVGFYLGIDTPPLAFHRANGESSKSGSGGRIDTAEFLSAVGTFLADVGGFCIGRRDCASRRSAQHLDHTNNAGMGRWRDDANHCRNNCTDAYLIFRYIPLPSQSPEPGTFAVISY